MSDLTGYVAVVTGGNRGIGLGMAEGLADAGADVAVWGRDAARNAEAADALRNRGVRVHTEAVDVSDEEQVAAAMAGTVGALGKVDSMVVNAGVGGGAPFLEQTLEGWRHVQRVNSEGAFLCFREAARHLVERGQGGALVGVSSASAIHGAPRNQSYAHSKAGMLAMVRGLAVELARHRIRVNAVIPGWIHTEMTAGAAADDRFIEVTTRRTPVRRWGVPDDFRDAAVYLADPRNGFHTGDALVIDGGYTVF